MIKYDDNFFSLKTVLEITKDRKPDFNNLLKVLNREAPDRATLFEFFLNNDLYSALTNVDLSKDDLTTSKRFELTMHAFKNAGYDYVTIPSTFGFPLKTHAAKKSISQNDTIMIRDRQSFDEYVWPDLENVDFSYMDKLDNIMLKGMKGIPWSPGGILENTTQLLGYESMCYLLYDDPQLLSDVFEKVGSILLRYYDKVLDYNCVGASIVNDDWGYKTQTMLKLEDMRKYVIPWHKKYVDRIHKSGIPAILHSCGNLDEVYDDIIDYIGFDAKHSFEDTIKPVETFYEEYKDRISILGGIDLDYVCSKTPFEVYSRSKSMLDKTIDFSGYALGTGNSVPDYVPHQNYYALILAALTYR